LKKLTLTNAEYSAINDIRGLDPEAFSMVVRASVSKSSWTLNGSDAALKALLDNLTEEVYEQVCPKAAELKLVKAISKIEIVLGNDSPAGIW